ncbi:PREDICTED: cx9C motif-containing protein 4 [Nanorana parkeri]|uniref:cx9C motif-containing protein 4 n=1 Tax=Nanorana parkeri TaxID=125878 RepID=UPI0008549C66|nr:PREDICTED: cx9C motif-containing protein 4 [Nanorana parkeri]
MSQKKDPCQKAACAIQKCLQENNYKESLCQPELQEMRICCSRILPQKSACCSGFHSQTPTDGKTDHQSVK